jgi:hypothetical protein
VILAGKNFVARLRDQFVLLNAQPLAGVVRGRRTFLQNGVGGDHLPRNEVRADTEMFERSMAISP